MIPHVYEITDFFAAQPILAGLLTLVLLFGSMVIWTRFQGWQARRSNKRAGARRALDRFRTDGA